MRFLLLLALLVHPLSQLQASIVYKEWNKPLNQTIHYIVFDPKEYQVVIAKGKECGNGLESVSSMQTRYGSVAGINGGFFKTNGTPSGVLKINGKWFTGSAEARSAIAWKTGTSDYHFGRFTVEFSLKTTDQTIQIDALNIPENDSQIIAYTPIYAQSTLSNPSAKELVIKQGIIEEIRQGGKAALIPQDAVVVTFGKNKVPLIDTLKVGDKADIIEKYPEDAWKQFDNILGGTPLLILDGKIVEDMTKENIHSTFLELRHPRTAIGMREDGKLIFIIVEGRKLGQSKGVTIKELAEYMLELGCISALNLDGGSSSAMVLQNKEIKGAFRNASDVVSNALLILPK